jgi:CPA2 family monovalent cation:H+ antiporter-2
VVIELNSKTAALARSHDLTTYVGDATRHEVLEHASVQTAAAVVVTIPDPATAQQVIQHVRSLSPHTPVIARARYHLYQQNLIQAGATAAVDEEDEVGSRMAAVVKDALGATDSPPSTSEPRP